MEEQSSPQQSAQMSISTQGAPVIQPNNQPNPSLSEMKAYDALGNQCPTTTPGLEPGQDVGRDVRKPMPHMADLSDLLSNLHLDCCLQFDQATPAQGTKEWHMSVTPDIRNHFIYKLVLEILPSPDAQVMLDERMKNLIAYAKTVEGDIYEMANSSLEYYQLLDEKIHEILKELDEKRQRRKERLLQVQQQLQQLCKQRVHPILD